MALKFKVDVLKKIHVMYMIIFAGIVVVVVAGVYWGISWNTQKGLSVNYAHSSDVSTSNNAAVSLAFQSVGSNFSIGDTFDLILVVNSPFQAMNTVGGTVVFDPTKLQLTSIDKTNSVMNLWVTDPSNSVSNSSGGSIVFLGGVTAPGFIGNQGQIFTLSFKVIGTGNTSITLANAQVLANDGVGTDLLSFVTPSQIVLKSAIAPIVPASADVNNDGKVDIKDFSVMLSEYGKKVTIPAVTTQSVGGATPLASSDLNHDGVVDIKDISILLSRFSLKK